MTSMFAVQWQRSSWMHMGHYGHPGSANDHSWRGVLAMSRVFLNCRITHLRVRWCLKMILVYLETPEYW
jgi:hypothetical protein